MQDKDKHGILNKRLLVCVSLISSFLFLPISITTPVFGQSFGPVTNLSNTTHGAECQSIKVSNNNVYAAWADGNIGGGDILFRRSTDGGNTFSNVIDLSDMTADQANCPRIAVSGNNVYVVWHEVSISGSFDVFFRKSSNGGLSFDSIKNLSHNKGDSSFPQIASAGNRVYVVWDDDTPPDFMTFFTRSRDSGTSFGPVKNLVKPPIEEALNAVVAVSGHTVYVVWTGNAGDLNQVYMRISTDGGNNFGSTRNISNDTSDSGRANLRASGNNVYVAWESDQSGNREIFFKKSSNMGSTFSKSINISQNPSQSFEPLISSSGNTIYVVWTDEAGQSASDVLFKRSTNGGSSFTHVRNLSSNLASAKDPSLSKDGSNVQVAWEDTSNGNSEIFLKKSSNLGMDFNPRVDVSNSPGTSIMPKTASFNGIIYVTWIERVSDSESDLLVVKSTDSTASIFGN
jgi:hypothetical protein